MQSAFIYLDLTLQRLLRLEDGQDLIEYAMLALLIAVGAVATIGNLAGYTYHMYHFIYIKFTQAVGL